MSLTKFSFRTVNGVKRDTVELDIPQISLQHVLESADAKSIPFLQELIDSAVYDRVREILAENTEITGPDNFPFAELEWEKVINVPVSERKGRGIPKEVWDDFDKDFQSVMVQHSGKTEAQVKNVATMLRGKLQAVKFNKPVLQKLAAEYLPVYANSTARLEEFAPVVEFLSAKAEEFLLLDQAATADAL